MRIFTFTFFVFAISCLLAQPKVESFVTNTGSGGSNAVVNKPSGVNSGDLLVIGLIYEKGSSESITVPSGWTLIERTDNGTDAGLATYYRVAGLSEPASYSFSFANGSKWCIGASRITGVNTVSPIDAFGGSTGSGSTLTAPSITTSNANGLVLCFYTNKKAATYTPDGTLIEIYDAPNSSQGQPSNMMALFSQASAGATDSKDATASESEQWAAQQVGINFGGAFPIELVSFDLNICQGSQVCLNWQTASEINNDFFTVERSKSGQDWNEVDIIQGAGMSDELIQYNTTDKAPLSGTSFYRIKQTDFDGTFTYSEVETITLQHTRGTIKAYPNPVQDILTVEGAASELKELKLYDFTGRELSSQTQIQRISETEYRLNISQWMPGYYFIRTKTAGQRIVKN